MNSLRSFLGPCQRGVTCALVTGLMLLGCVSCESSKGSTNTDESQAKATAGQDNKLKIFHQHDIPPDMAIDVGSFAIETKLELQDTDAPAQTKKGSYSIDPTKDTDVALIKIIRTDDGAILYQNFEAKDNEIEFTTTGGPSKTITLKPGNRGGKKAFALLSKEDKYLAKKPPQNPIRLYRFESDDYKVTNITVRKNNKDLFSHDTSSGSAEYPDRRYRVLIRFEVP